MDLCATMDAKKTFTAARKDLYKVRRRTSKSQTSRKLTAPASTLTMPIGSASLDLEQLLADLSDNAIPEPTVPSSAECVYDTSKAPPNVFYYTMDPATQHYARPVPPNPPQPPPTMESPDQEPRLLMRQIYRIANQADAVIGLECTRNRKASIYLVNNNSSVNLTLEDVLSLRGKCASVTIDNYFSSGNEFSPIYLDTVVIESCGNGNIIVGNYLITQSRDYFTTQKRMYLHDEAQSANLPQGVDIFRHSSRVVFNADGWKSLRRMFDAIEHYYGICLECSPVIQQLIQRYGRFFSRNYRTKAIINTYTKQQASAENQNPANSDFPLSVSPDLTRQILADLPYHLSDIHEWRLPLEPHLDNWYERSPLRQSLLPWIDAEVRRFCVSNIAASIVDQLQGRP